MGCAGKESILRHPLVVTFLLLFSDIMFSFYSEIIFQYIFYFKIRYDVSEASLIVLFKLM